LLWCVSLFYKKKPKGVMERPPGTIRFKNNCRHGIRRGIKFIDRVNRYGRLYGNSFTARLNENSEGKTAVDNVVDYVEDVMDLTTEQSHQNLQSLAAEVYCRTASHIISPLTL